MRSYRSSASIVMLLAGVFAGEPAASAAETSQPSATPAVAPATTQPVDPRVADAIQKITNATDPSNAVEAYAAARSIAPDSIPVGQAYVARLIALGVPEMAESQARDLTRRAPDDGIAWAVAAFMDARRDGMRAALEEISIAAKKSPNDPFVQRTAGQLIAFHDRQPREESSPDSLETTVAETRGALTGKTDFDMAYRASSEAYAQRPATEPETIGRYRYTAPTDTYDDGGPSVAYNDNYSGYGQPYYTSPYYSGVPYCGYYGPIFFHHVGFNDSHFHSHFDHHDFDHHDDHHDSDHGNFHNNGFTHSGFRDTGRSFDGRTGHWSGSRDAGMVPRGGSTIDRGDRYIGGGVNPNAGRGGSDSGFRGGSMSGTSGAARGGGMSGASGGARAGSGGGGHR